MLDCRRKQQTRATVEKELDKGKGLWEEYSHLNYSRLNSSILSGGVEEEIRQLARLEPILLPLRVKQDR